VTAILLALAPVFGLIVIGYGLRARGVFGETFWDGAERLTFYFLFPALLVSAIGAADAVGLALLPMAAALVTATLAAAALAMALKPRLAGGGDGDGGPRFAAVFQGAIRPNTYVGIAAAFAIWGEAGLTLVAAAIVAVIPLVNVLAIVAHHRWAKAPGVGAEATLWQGTVLPTVRNPIIVACLVGWALNAGGVGLPPVIGPMLEILGRGALPLGLMAVGAGLRPRGLGGARAAVALATAFKLGVTPAVTWLACLAFGVTGTTQAVAVMFMALPVSAASYVMSRQLGGDGPLMAAIVTATTIGAAITLPAWIIAAGV